MHAGNIHHATKAGRVYRYLMDRGGAWTDAYDIAMGCETLALSTRISEVRRQLPPDLHIEHKREGKRNYYRIIRSIISQPARKGMQ